MLPTSNCPMLLHPRCPAGPLVSRTRTGLQELLQPPCPSASRVPSQHPLPPIPGLFFEFAAEFRRRKQMPDHNRETLGHQRGRIRGAATPRHWSPPTLETRRGPRRAGEPQRRVRGRGESHARGHADLGEDGESVPGRAGERSQRKSGESGGEDGGPDI